MGNSQVRPANPLNLCATCNEDFSGVRLFDLHRVGKHEYTFVEGMRMNPPREDGRRCLDVEEMRAKGWEKDKRGRWSNPADAARLREAFAKG